jgi:carbonic anhydrase
MYLWIFTVICAGCLSLWAESGMDRLMQGNQRYVKDELEHANRTTERRESVVCKQSPFAIIIGCSDSRVSPEILFDQGVGDLFVVRVAGNVIGSIELDSIDYAALVLKSSLIVVLGHENCGAVQAVLDGNTAGIESIARLIHPAIDAEKKEKPPHLLENYIKKNAQNMKEYLLKTSIIKKLVKEGKLEVHAAYYDLQTGAVQLL